MIINFSCKRTKKLFNEKISSFDKTIEVKAYFQLLELHNANTFLEITSMNGSNLKKLKNSEYHSIRVNKKWRILFIWDWEESNALEVRLVNH